MQWFNCNVFNVSDETILIYFYRLLIRVTIVYHISIAIYEVPKKSVIRITIINWHTIYFSYKNIIFFPLKYLLRHKPIVGSDLWYSRNSVTKRLLYLFNILPINGFTNHVTHQIFPTNVVFMCSTWVIKIYDNLYTCNNEL